MAKEAAELLDRTKPRPDLMARLRELTPKELKVLAAEEIEHLRIQAALTLCEHGEESFDEVLRCMVVLFMWASIGDLTMKSATTQLVHLATARARMTGKVLPAITREADESVERALERATEKKAKAG